ncbi:MAG: membrane protein insertase YidC [Phycisphaerae bacterium]|nr:membrane protein insertase YidC [Phycisphaerae bacterium]
MDFDYKRLLIAFLLCMAITTGWQYYMNEQHPPQPQAPATQNGQTNQNDQGGPAAGQIDGANTNGQQTGISSASSARWHLKESPLEQRDAVLGHYAKQDGKGYNAQITIDPATASVREVLLSEHKLKVNDKETGYPLLTAALDENGTSVHSLMIGRLKVNGQQEIINLSRNCWTLEPGNSGGNSAAYIATVLDGEDREVLQIRKIYRYQPNQYDLDFTVEFINKSSIPLKVDSLEFTGPTGLIREAPRADVRNSLIAFTEDGKYNAEKLTLTEIENEFDVERLETPDNATLQWFGATNKYFAVAVRPVPSQDHSNIDFFNQKYITVTNLPIPDTARQLIKTPGTLSAMILLTPQDPIAPTGTLACNFKVYLGAADKRIFDNPDYGYGDFHYEHLLYQQSCNTCSFDFLNVALLWLMNGVYFLTGNYGISIIVLVLMVRLVLHPISKKSQINMQQMGKLGPKIEEIKTKYAGNKEEIQRQTMAVYKDQGFTPILGCLPMLLQMPIWIALFTTVGSNVALRHQGLLPASWHWLTDLSSPDRLIPFSWFGQTTPLEIPLITNLVGPIDAFNLLPILLCVAMYLQTKFSPQASMANANPQAAQQQKMMMYMMPVMMLLFFYNASTGLNLYIMSSTFAGLIEQHYIRKHLREKQEVEEKSTVMATSKISQKFGPKKKKPKPPTKFG